MRTVFFGTYDESAHPRVRVLREGLTATGATVATCNVPLGVDTAARVEIVAAPWRALAFAVRLLFAWLRLAWRARQLDPPDVVLVGYLGTFDVHLARLLFRRATLVLDEMAPLAGTAEDRALGVGVVRRLLAGLDRAARRRADIVLHDTDEHDAAYTAGAARSVVVPVGAPADWLQTRPAEPPTGAEPVRVVFYGLYTPLQGTDIIARAIAGVPPGTALAFTMVGDGQDRSRCETLVGTASVAVQWIDWVDADALPQLVADHHVCLGIFGSGTKAQRVVPNKAFQGAAAGCAVVTSRTPPQERTMADAAVLVPPGDPDALREVLVSLARDRRRLAEVRDRARRWALDHSAPARVVQPLVELLER
jgi:glycosyltransferase involved in cell wall biosynthesis